jgi:hypothetical protein
MVAALEPEAGLEQRPNRPRPSASSAGIVLNKPTDGW